MRRRSEDGYALLVILLVLSVLIISMAKALPGWKTEIQREREARTIDHAREYRTAIKRYFHKNGRYPASLDALLQKDGNGIRYLRQKWPDTLSATAGDGTSSDSGDSSSLTSSNDTGGWQLLHYGQAVNAEIVDQPPKAALAATGSSAIAGPGLSGGSVTGMGASAPGGNFGGLGGSNGSSFGNQAGAVPSGSGQFGQGGTTGVGGSIGGVGGTAGQSGSGLTPVTSGPGSVTSSSGGGGPIIGVASMSKKPAVHSFNGFDIPNDWQFVYNYAQDPSLTVGGGTSGGGLAPTQPGGGSIPTPTGPGGVGTGGVGSGGIGSGGSG